VGRGWWHRRGRGWGTRSDWQGSGWEHWVCSWGLVFRSSVAVFRGVAYGSGMVVIVVGAVSFESGEGEFLVVVVDGFDQ